MNNYPEKSNIRPIEEWLPSKTSPLVISGPCSAESREQVLKTAELLHQTGVVSAFRSGVWKPRTRPGAFEGHGEQALDWLKDVKRIYGFPLVVEVATPRHIDAALKAGVDVLWIGARTTVNPFSVQELAEALKGIDIPVMVKNPLNPELALWTGAIERFMLSGITKIAAIHRGFNMWGKSIFRNEPLWEIPVKLKTIFPDLPIITDPSHIAGRTDLIAEIAQQALLLGTNGFMIEAHFNPSEALTDAAQQLLPSELYEMIVSLKVPLQKNENPCHDLDTIRHQIDSIDSTLINTLAQRMQYVKDIARIKKDCKMAILQVNRWNSIVLQRTSEGNKKGLSEDFVRSILDSIHKESIRIQSEYLGSAPNNNQ